MDTKKALEVVKAASAQYKGTLQDHNNIQTALSLIEQELSKPEKPDKKGKTDG